MKYTGRVYIVREKSNSVGIGIVLNKPMREFYLDEMRHAYQYKGLYLECPNKSWVFSPNNPQGNWFNACKIAEISFVNYLKELES